MEEYRNKVTITDVFRAVRNSLDDLSRSILIERSCYYCIHHDNRSECPIWIEIEKIESIDPSSPQFEEAARKIKERILNLFLSDDQCRMFTPEEVEAKKAAR